MFALYKDSILIVSRPSVSLKFYASCDSPKHSVDWTRDWTRDWTVGLDSQKVALIILKHQTLLKYLHDMNGIRGSR